MMKWKHVQFSIVIVGMIFLFPYLYGRQFGAVGCLLFSGLFFFLAYREWKSIQRNFCHKKKQYKD